MIFDIKSHILGFENITKVSLEKIDDTFMKLIDCDANKDAKPLFTLVDPYALRDYKIEIPIAIKVLLDINKSTNILVLNIMMLQNPIEKSLINFIAPLIFNFDNKLMGQMVLDSVKYKEYGLAEEISKFYSQGK